MSKSYSNSSIKINPIGPTLEELHTLLINCGKMLGVRYQPSIQNENSELKELLEIKKRIKKQIK